MTVTIEAPATTRPIYRHHHLEPTRRGWMFLGRHGGPCDKACKMCYYAYQKDLTFFDLNTLLFHANRMKYYYSLDYCDISGGEPTIYGAAKEGRRPELERLIAHCAAIGLKPTIITHGQNNTEALVKGVEDAGLEDWLISMHGLEAGHERTVVNHAGKGDGGWQRLAENLRYCQRPVRFNTTVQNFNVTELPALARWLASNQPPTVWNMIQFNPFYAWAGKEVIEFQATMTEIAPFIGNAVHIAEAAGWEVNVRYFPFCVADEHGFSRNCINFYQTQYDPWEWDLLATNGAPMPSVEAVGGVEAARRLFCDQIAKTRENEHCASCRFRPICEGPTEQYQGRFGLDELKPVQGEPVTDVSYFERGGRYANDPK